MLENVSNTFKVASKSPKPKKKFLKPLSYLYKKFPQKLG